MKHIYTFRSKGSILTTVPLCFTLHSMVANSITGLILSTHYISVTMISFKELTLLLHIHIPTLLRSL